MKADAARAARRPRVLFFAEAVTLAHVARPHVLAKALVDRGYEVLVARDPRYRALFPDSTYRTADITSISCAQFFSALASGRPIYSLDTLRGYARQDLHVIDGFAPDLVVGDFRLSLSVSARLARVPHLAITNAYWSAYAQARFTVPEIPLVRALGVRAADAVFRAIRPCAFAWHTRPLNRLRHEFGMDSLGLDLRRIYTDADHTLYADLPQLVPTSGLPPNHAYLGPILWSPAIPRPDWWDDLPGNAPVVYVNLGSSGPRGMLKIVLDALATLPVTVIAATAGQKVPDGVPANAFVAEYLPGDQAASRARLVICNGGSPSTQQALAYGVPVLGIASNLDQYANMHYVQQAAAGVLVRAGRASVGGVRSAVASMLQTGGAAAGAAAIQQATQRFDAATRFARRVSGLLMH